MENLLIHIARIRKRAENGFYHLQAGTIRNPFQLVIYAKVITHQQAIGDPW